jgi:hypothetical protein
MRDAPGYLELRDTRNGYLCLAPNTRERPRSRIDSGAHGEPGDGHPGADATYPRGGFLSRRNAPVADMVGITATLTDKGIGLRVPATSSTPLPHREVDGQFARISHRVRPRASAGASARGHCQGQGRRKTRRSAAYGTQAHGLLICGLRGNRHDTGTP